LAHFLKKKRVDLVNLNNSIKKNHEWMLAAKIAGVKCITHQMGIPEQFSAFSRFLGSRLDGIFSLSYSITKSMKRLGLDYPNIHTIHCGIDLSRYQIRQTPDELRKKYHISIDSPVIGVVGNIKPWKGQETVVRATQLVKQVFPHVRCLLVGGTSDADLYYLEMLKDLCKKLKLTENIIFTGFQENPIDFMNLMCVIIHSSISPEPFGIVNLEAMSVKKPIISTKIGAPAEIFEHGKSAILVEPGNPQALAEACTLLLNDRAKAKAMGMAAYERLTKKFTLRKNIQKTEELYDTILGTDHRL
jgi:glycosyltransferase involved in cell wall biosynthesis